MEKASYREVLEMLNTAFPGRDVLTMQEVCQYMRADRRSLLQTKQFPAIKIAGKYAIHKAPFARWLSA